MKNVTSKSILIGNGININFGGKAYTNNYIIKRILFNARASRYDPLFNGEISGDEIASIFVGLATWANAISDGKYDAIIGGIIDDALKKMISAGIPRSLPVSTRWCSARPIPLRGR